MSSADQFDTIVIGLGAMGSAAVYHLARRGVKVCGIEQHELAHDFGSSHGTVRAIRKAYFEHPDYIPLINSAYGLWQALEEESDTSLFVQNGILLSGSPDSETIRGLERCYAEHDLPHERLSWEETRGRFPQFSLPESYVSYFDPIGGYGFCEESIRAHANLAEKFGAELRIHETARQWHATDAGVVVHTDRGEVHASNLVLTVGPWAGEIFSELGISLRVTRRVQLWYESPNIEDYSPEAFPTFCIETGGSFYYGFPALDDRGMKVAEHWGDNVVDDPAAVTRSLKENDQDNILPFLSTIFPEMEPALTHFSVCMYTMSPDEHFVIDFHPTHANVILAAGFSGHGFKFAPVIGEVLADLATEGTTHHPVGFLGLSRFKD